MLLPPPQSLSNLESNGFSAIVTLLFEHSPDLESLFKSDAPLDKVHSYSELIITARDMLIRLVPQTADLEAPVLDAILGAHPRLGAPKAAALSTASASEQAQLQAADSPEAIEEAHHLARLNQEYELRFPPLRYVVFVNARPRSVIMHDMQRRIAHSDRNTERIDAIQAMCDIASDRVAKATVTGTLEEWRNG